MYHQKIETMNEINIIEKIMSDKTFAKTSNIIVSVHEYAQKSLRKKSKNDYEKLSKKLNFKLKRIYLDNKMTDDTTFRNERESLLAEAKVFIDNQSNDTRTVLLISPFLLDYLCSSPKDLMNEYTIIMDVEG